MRWVIGHATFAAYPDTLVGADPIYKYGIVMQVSSKDARAIVVHSCGLDTADHRLIILDGDDDDVEILSKGG